MDKANHIGKDFSLDLSEEFEFEEFFGCDSQSVDGSEAFGPWQPEIALA